MIFSACPYPDLEFQENQPFELISFEPEDYLEHTLAKGCEEKGGAPEEQIRLTVDYEDPDGDTLRYYWYVNYQGEFQESADLENLNGRMTISACSYPGLRQDGAVNIVQVLVMDREAADIPPRTPTEGGFMETMTWTFTLNPGTFCCDEFPEN